MRGLRLSLIHIYVTLQVPAGSFAALVGPSGGGKSTAGQLLARFWDVESGSIAIGGKDIRDYTAKALMETVSFVFQDTYLFAESVYDNIAMHRNVSREAVERAAKAARCHEFIQSLPAVSYTHLAPPQPGFSALERSAQTRFAHAGRTAQTAAATKNRRGCCGCSLSAKRCILAGEGSL